MFRAQYLWGFLVLLCVSNVSGQKPVYYFMGRPADYTYNNAVHTIADSWKIEVDYAGFDVIEQFGFEPLNDYNDSVSKVIATQTGIGEGWIDSFLLLVRLEDKRQDALRTQLVKILSEEIKLLSAEFVEPFFLFERHHRTLRYTCYLVGQKREGENKAFQVKAAWKVKKKRDRLHHIWLDDFRRIRKPSPVLPFTIKANGIG
ncbi:MAG: hypothetical protein ACK49D_09295 [Flavobacteriia bacterium]|jgi:hypothetical protein